MLHRSEDSITRTASTSTLKDRDLANRQGSDHLRTTRLVVLKALKAKARDGYIMRLKSELYAPEQDKIRTELWSVLGLDANNSITLYELDNDTDKQKRIMDMIPKVRTFFKFGRCDALKYPEQSKRPWWSMIKFLTKDEYDILICDHRIYNEGESPVRTKRYVFLKKST